MVSSANLGFPRMGANRELKKLVEAYWAGKVTEQELQQGSKDLRAAHWKLQKDSGIDIIPSNDFSFYDHVLDAAHTFGVIPSKYQHLQSGLESYFAMGRGLQRAGDANVQAVDVPAQEMKKWFDTNYHYIVPEFTSNQQFSLANSKPIDEYLEAKAIGIETRPVILGPISFLLLGKAAKGDSVQPIQLLEKLVPVYEQLLSKLKQAGASDVQLDEPVLILDQPASIKDAFKHAYEVLVKSSPRILVATYFGRLDSNVEFLTQLPIHGIHLDLVRAPEQLDSVLKVLPAHQTLSLGVINGRNIWKANLSKAIETVNKAVQAIGSDRVIVAPSCSMLHTPHSTESETKMDQEILDWLAFSAEKLHELATIKEAVATGPASVQVKLQANADSLARRAASKRIHRQEVKDRVNNISPDQLKRRSPFPERQKLQQEKLKLPKFPTTTVGSFPQTREVRLARSKLKKGEYTPEQYDEFIKGEVQKCVKFQEDANIDVLVHGEFERNDMVEFFGENFEGHVFTQNGWVQSYGSRCVKPPVIFGDVSRSRPITVYWSQYAQSLTKKPMKGMLTGPITCLQWSFVRDDQPRKDTANQLAFAIRDEVVDLEKAGIPVIQIDEPAIREGLPLRRADWDAYLQWAVDAFLLSSTGVHDQTQIHTHMCYSDFNDIFPSIKRMDADVITIENSKSDLKLLNAFEQHSYTNEIGPGVYDIHSPRVPSVQEMQERVAAMLKYLPTGLVWVNPDCGLKTRGWPEVEQALRNLTQVAQSFRAQA
ncbi:methionine-synthesizing 5- methyltetrahydropteroyltriglutamate--homocysteine methyltransferase [Entomophthora muscae]|uniref:Methionine-synthesizing 5-methyltetrahydropteroyltriglutamate--homocysteine methyltransferase n=1 Tax=Entomophthora muscae TaxID=34485 RepID=A0ACC2T5M9_9FUNG|nr:methionine-synthesizing 5- methyltetrahydropteroyltriglutamate--homocysteine methyltransferase [Entomophthora muscae]